MASILEARMAGNDRTFPSTKPRAVTRRAQLVQAAITVFSRMGYHEATLRHIANTAGVSVGLAYQYVEDKHDLLFLALQHIVETNRREIPNAIDSSEDALVRLIRSIDAYTRVIAANQDAVLLTYRESKSLRANDLESIKKMELETNALIATCVDECIAAGYLKPHHTELLVFRIITAAHAWALKHWRLRFIATLDEYVEHSIHACWQPLLTAKGRKRRRQLVSPTTK